MGRILFMLKAARRVSLRFLLKYDFVVVLSLLMSFNLNLCKSVHILRTTARQRLTCILFYFTENIIRRCGFAGGFCEFPVVLSRENPTASRPAF